MGSHYCSTLHVREAFKDNLGAVGDGHLSRMRICDDRDAYRFRGAKLEINKAGTDRILDMVKRISEHCDGNKEVFSERDAKYYKGDPTGTLGFSDVFDISV